jgi:hypothetical protein
MSILNSRLRIDTPDDSLFITLDSGESYSLENNLYLPIHDSTASDQFLRAGAHVLQITVVTWYYQPELAASFRARLRQEGLLWTESVTSTPMRFMINRHHPIVSCS